MSEGCWSLGALESLDLSRTQLGMEWDGAARLAQGLKRMWGLRRLLLAGNRLQEQVS